MREWDAIHDDPERYFLGRAARLIGTVIVAEYTGLCWLIPDGSDQGALYEASELSPVLDE
jgi:hypothetical protein